METSPLEFDPGIVTRAPLRILSVEDSPTAQVLLRHLLQGVAPACELMEAQDGKSALRLLSSRAVDLIVCDLHMPGLDGPGFLQLLRRNSLLRSKPVLVVTGSPQDAGPDITADPCARVLAKPLDAGALGRGLGALLAGAGDRKA